MTTSITAALTGLFCTLVSSIVTFFLTKRKYVTEVESNQIKNLNDAFDLYKKTVKDTITSQNEKIDALQKENEGLRQQINNLQMQIFELMKGRMDSNKPELTVEKP